VSDEPRTIRLVLDATAVAAYTRGSVAVGELLGEIDDEHGAVVIPLACLVEAGHATALLERPLLDALLSHAATFLIVDNPDHWVELVELRSIVGKLDLASAALLALDSEVYVLTRDARWYSGVAGGGIALEFDD
jgi:hypothetical protein